MCTLDKGLIHIQSSKEKDDVRFHKGIQNSVQFNIYELFISGIFPLIYPDHSWPHITKSAESETMGNGDCCPEMLMAFQKGGASGRT